MGAQYFYIWRESLRGPSEEAKRPACLRGSEAGAGTFPGLSCHSPTLRRNSEFVAGSAGGGRGGGESVFLTSFAGGFDVGGLWALF